jgi:hypothetical protein
MTCVSFTTHVTVGVGKPNPLSSFRRGNLICIWHLDIFHAERRGQALGQNPKLSRKGRLGMLRM